MPRANLITALLIHLHSDHKTVMQSCHSHRVLSKTKQYSPIPPIQLQHTPPFRIHVVATEKCIVELKIFKWNIKQRAARVKCETRLPTPPIQPQNVSAGPIIQ